MGGAAAVWAHLYKYESIKYVVPFYRYTWMPSRHPLGGRALLAPGGRALLALHSLEGRALLALLHSELHMR